MSFAEFLEQYGFFIALTIFLVIAIFLVFFLLLPRVKKSGDDTVDVSESKDKILDLLGGKDNIKAIALKGSRLSVEVSDQSLVQFDELKKHGVDRVIVMQSKLVLLVDKHLQDLFNKLS